MRETDTCLLWLTTPNKSKIYIIIEGAKMNHLEAARKQAQKKKEKDRIHESNWTKWLYRLQALLTKQKGHDNNFTIYQLKKANHLFVRGRFLQCKCIRISPCYDVLPLGKSKLSPIYSLIS